LGKKTVTKEILDAMGRYPAGMSLNGVGSVISDRKKGNEAFSFAPLY
jgi:hypothetical protein